MGTGPSMMPAMAPLESATSRDWHGQGLFSRCGEDRELEGRVIDAGDANRRSGRDIVVTATRRKRKRCELDQFQTPQDENAVPLENENDKNRKRRRLLGVGRNPTTWKALFAPPSALRRNAREHLAWSSRCLSARSQGFPRYFRALPFRRENSVTPLACRTLLFKVEGTLLRTENVGGAVHSIAFSPSRSSLEGEPQVKAIRLSDGATSAATALVSIAGIDRNVFSVLPNPVLPFMVATASDDENFLQLRHGDDATASLLSAKSTTATTMRRLAWHPNGVHCAAGEGDGTIRVWNTLSNRLLATLSGKHDGHITSLSFHPQNGKFLLSGCFHGRVYIWETLWFQVVQTLKCPNTSSLSWEWSVSYSPTGAWIASDVENCCIRLWSNATCGSANESVARWRRRRDLKGHSHHVTCLAWSPPVFSSQELLVSGSLDRTVRVWDVAKGQCITTLGNFSRVVRAVAWSGDDNDDDCYYIAAGSNDCTVKIWKVRNVVANKLL